MNFEIVAIILGVSNPNFTNKYENFLLMVLHLIKYCFIIGLCYIYFGATIKENGEIGTFMMRLFRISICFTGILAIYHSWKNSDKEKKIFTDQNIKNLTFWQIVLISVTVIVAPTLFYEKEQRLIQMLFSDLTVKATCIRFVLAVEIITRKYKDLSKEIKALMISHEEFKAFIFECKYFIVNHNQKDIQFDEKIVKFMKRHNDISVLVPLVNEVYGARLFFIVFTFFISIMYFAYNFFIEIETTQNPDVIVGSFCYLVSTILILIWICNTTQSCANRANLVGCYLHCLHHKPQSSMLKRFSHQILVQKVAFSAGGFFEINFRLIVKIFATLLTYEIILIQFHLEGRNRRN